MSGLAAARDSLAALLAGITITAPQGDPDPSSPVSVLTYVPEAIQPPVVVLQPAEDYVTSGEEDATFAPTEYVVTEEVWLLVDLVDNQAAARELDEILESVLLAITPSVWWVKSIGQPGPVHTSEWLSHGLLLQVSTFTTL